MTILHNYNNNNNDNDNSIRRIMYIYILYELYIYSLCIPGMMTMMPL